MKYLSLFSGIGGFELGIQNSKYKDKLQCIGYSEVDKYAESIYKKHFPTRMAEGRKLHKALGDITKVRTSDLPDFELLVGGSPCQSFSIAGKRGGFDDTRGTLFFEFARILRDKRPRYFLFENVKNLLSHDNGKTFKTILEVFASLGYDVEWEILNSKNFGVPQNRERIFIKGYLREKCGREILSFRRINKEVADKIERINSPYASQGQRLYDSNHQSLAMCSSNPAMTNGLYAIDESEEKQKELNLIPLNKKAQAQTIYDINGISCTLSANGGGQGGKTGLYKIPSDFKQIDDNYHWTTTQNGDAFAVTTRCRNTALKKKQDNYIGEETQNNFRVRRLTPLEAERLQGFPDNWTQCECEGKPISDTQRYKCIGNAVTTKVITHIFNNWDLKDENDNI